MLLQCTEGPMTANKLARYVRALLLVAMAFLSGSAYADRPEAPVLLCISSLNCEGASDGDYVKWNPGFYMQVANGSSLQDRLRDLENMRNKPHLKGLKVNYTWRDLEGPNKGQYSWQDLDALLKKAADVGKSIQLELQTRSFGGLKFPGPAYLHESQYRGHVASESPGHFYSLDSDGDGRFDRTPLVAHWRPGVRASFESFLAALAQRYDNNPHFEMFATAETAFKNSQAGAEPDYSEQRMRDAWIGMARAWDANSQHTMFRFTTNFASYMPELFETLRDIKYGVAGGPDPIGLRNCVSDPGANPSDRILCGQTGGRDHRGLIGIATNVELADLDPNHPRNKSRGTFEDQYWKTHDNLRSNHINYIKMWTYPTWDGVIEPFLATAPFRNTRCPQSFNQRCRSLSK